MKTAAKRETSERKKRNGKRRELSEWWPLCVVHCCFALLWDVVVSSSLLARCWRSRVLRWEFQDNPHGRMIIKSAMKSAQTEYFLREMQTRRIPLCTAWRMASTNWAGQAKQSLLVTLMNTFKIRWSWVKPFLFFVVVVDVTHWLSRKRRQKDALQLAEAAFATVVVAAMMMTDWRRRWQTEFN